MAERYLAGVYGRLRQLPAPDLEAPDAPSIDTPTRRAEAFPRTRPEAAVGTAHRDRWHAVYDDVRRRHAAGESLPQIQRALGIALGTARRFAHAATFPERAKPPPRPSMLDPHLVYLTARHAPRCENALQLWRELRARGYLGGSQQVHRWLRTGRRVPAPKYPGPRQVAVAAHAATRRPTRPALPSPRQLAWLADARASDVRAVQTFAARVVLDGAAVRAALTTSWSNAQSEGHVAKLKLLKRQMCGRATFDLLRRRVLLAA